MKRCYVPPVGPVDASLVTTPISITHLSHPTHEISLEFPVPSITKLCTSRMSDSLHLWRNRVNIQLLRCITIFESNVWTMYQKKSAQEQKSLWINS
jgi:hypothetical protein